MDPPTSSSLAVEKRVCSLLLSTAGAPFPTLAAVRTLVGSKFPAGVLAAYDKSMAKPNRPVRWSLWLAAGVLFGLVLGFAFGLAKPRLRK
jgi:hypothetical protein